MRFLFVNPPVRENEPPISFPLGIGYLSRVLMDGGHDVKVMDIDAHRYSRETVEKLVSQAEFDIVGTGGLITTYSYVKWLVPLLRNRNPNAKIILGGSLATSAPHVVMNKLDVDAACIGEGELTLLDFVDSVEKNMPLKEVRGIWYKDEGGVHVNAEREQIKDLDSIKFPAWEALPLELYANVSSGISEFKRKMNVISSRGCPYRCNYCYHPFGYTYRMRSAENLIEEIKLLYHKYGIRFVMFNDDNVIVDRKRIMDFCKKLKSESLDIEWTAPGRVNLVDEEFLREMRSGGCTYIGFGLESGSPRMLAAMNKNATVEQARNAIALCKKVGIKPHGTFMLGTPGENHDTIEETVNFIKELDLPEDTVLFITLPFPGTPLYEEAKARGLIPKDEEKYIEKLGDVNRLLVNMTELSDEEFLAAHREAQKKIRMPPLKKIMTYLKYYGPEWVVRRLWMKREKYFGALLPRINADSAVPEK